MPGFLPVGSFPVAADTSGSGGGGVVYSLTAAYARFQGTAYDLAYLFPPTRISWEGVEVVRSTADSNYAQTSWMGVEVVHIGVSAAFVTWIGLEVLRALDPASDSAITILW